MLHLLPIAGWWLFADGSFAALIGYSVAVPGQEPGLPPLVQLWSHNLHCVMHGAPIAALITGAVWAARRAFWVPLMGWWSHIVIDVFTHSADYYAVPVLYPFTERMPTALRLDDALVHGAQLCRPGRRGCLAPDEQEASGWSLTHSRCITAAISASSMAGSGRRSGRFHRKSVDSPAGGVWQGGNEHLTCAARLLPKRWRAGRG